MYADQSRRSAISVKNLLCSSSSVDSRFSSTEFKPRSNRAPARLNMHENYLSAQFSHDIQPSQVSPTSSVPSDPPSQSISSLLSSDSSQGKKPTRGPWRLEEDRLLIDLVRRYGACHWSAIAAFLPRRSGKQARERWINQLNPALKKKNWTAREDRVILHAHAVLGNKWSAIAQMLPGRTDNSVKNRFNSTLKRAMRERARSLDSGLAATPQMRRGVATSVSVNVDDVVDSLHAKPFGFQRIVSANVMSLQETQPLYVKPSDSHSMPSSDLKKIEGYADDDSPSGVLETPDGRHLLSNEPKVRQKLSGEVGTWRPQYNIESEYGRYQQYSSMNL